ncbi:MAG: hypothetical protein PHD11_07615 [Bacteroidales bacterium]|nr:hypothetical protein [Bacteroidales bacterium]MDD4669725.1 hypothetical protein [Bacteroidales bacterium]
MIEIKTKIHDSFSVEFKESFVVGSKEKDNNFAVNTWIFVPNSLDINPQTYGKDQFYRDVKSNVRLITPVYIMRDIVGGKAVPLNYLRNAMSNMASAPTKSNISEFEYQIKMFCAIAKSSMRDEVAHILSSTQTDDIIFLSEEYQKNLTNIVRYYRGLRQIINVPTITDQIREYFKFGDEFLGHISSLYTFRVIKKLAKATPDTQIKVLLLDFIKENEDYKKSMGYPVVIKGDNSNNQNLVFRHGILKKYVESDLFIKLDKKKDGFALEQILYAVAAGVAMIFATVVSFSVQRNYGSLSIPLFFALIISYMLKDRIKELMRYFFAHRLVAKYFDNKAIVKIKDQEVGWMKEGVDFITDQKTPKEVLDIRNRSLLVQAENRIFDEKIILYRKLVYIDSKELSDNNIYPVSGINDIFRLHVTRFTQKMDNPQQPLTILDADGNVSEITSQKIYYINIIIQVRYGENIDYKRFRIVMTRDGIQKVEEL